MWRLTKAISDGIASLGVVGLIHVFGIQQDAVGCIAHLRKHDQVPFERYSPSWRVSLLRINISPFFFSGADWSGAHFVP